MNTSAPRRRKSRAANIALALSLSGIIVGSALGIDSYPASASVDDITTIAGAGSGDGRPATAVGLYAVSGVAVDSAGNIYIAERFNYRVRKVDALTGAISTLAGTGEYNTTGDGGPAANAALVSPVGLAYGATDDSLYIGDGSNVRKVDLATGIIHHYAGGGNALGDGGPAATAALKDVSAISLDPAGNVYIADHVANRVRKVTAATGVITTVAGTGSSGNSGDGGAATAAKLDEPEGVAADALGNVYIADTANHRVRVVDSLGDIHPYAGTGQSGSSGNGGPATNATLDQPAGLALNGGDLVITDEQESVVRIVSGTTIDAYAGTGVSVVGGDGAPAIDASFAYPRTIAVDSVGDLFVGDDTGGQIRKLAAAAPHVASTVAGDGTGGYSGDGAAASAALLGSPHDVITLSNGDVVFSDENANVLRRVSAATGTITTFAGTGSRGFSGDGAQAVDARLSEPTGLAVDGDDSVYVSDVQNARIRKITAAGVISTIAGTGSFQHAGDNGPATSASILWVDGIAMTSTGDLVFAENGTRVRKIDHVSGIITTVAGTGATADFGDSGLATNAKFMYATDVAVDSSDNIVVLDTNARKVRRIDSLTTIITTVAGTGAYSSSGNGGPAVAASFKHPMGLTIDGADNLYVTDSVAEVARRIDATTHLISAVAGTGQPGFAGDNAPAISARLLSPYGIDVDHLGNIYIADSGNQRIRKIEAAAVPLVPPAPPTPPVVDPPVVNPPVVNPPVVDPPAAPTSTKYRPVQPERLLDTRVGVGAPVGPLTADSTIVLQVTGAGATNVPADAGAVVLNVTATNPQAPGYVTVWPCGQPRPTASNLNDVTGQTTPNLVIVKLGEDGTVCLYSQSTTDLIADINGWYPAGNDLESVQPERVLDTRNGTGSPSSPLTADGTLILRITGVGATNVPADAGAVVLNVTATNPQAPGYVTVWPCGQPRPTASNLNYVTGQTTPNLVIVKLGEDGTVCLYSQSTTDLIADINGWYPTGSDLTSVQPERLLDSRSGVGAAAAPLAEDSTLTLQVAGAGQTNIPADANAVVLNITVTDPQAAGYITAWPCGQPRPTASNLNYVAGQTVPNLAIVKLGDNGTVCLYTQSTSDLVADVNGWYVS